MFNKYVIWSGVFVALIVAYLFAAHFYIYHMIAAGHLQATDNRHLYIFNDQVPTTRTLTYAALGDSLTSGVGTDKYENSYPYIVAEKIAGDNFQVRHLNFSYPGARTTDLIRDLLDQAVAAQPDAVTLLIGTNDVHGNVSAKTFTENYDHILQELTQRTSAKINVVSIPLIGSDGLLPVPYNFYYRSKALKFNKIIGKLAANYQVNYIDLTTPTSQLLRQSGEHYAADSFHPSNLGYKLWAEIIYDHLNF